VSVEDTFGIDVTDPALLAALADRMSQRVVARLREARLSGRTVTLKVRLHDFTTHTRAATLNGPTDSVRVVTSLTRRLLADTDTSGGVRLLGVGVSGLADWIQDDLFDGLLPGVGPDEDAPLEPVLVDLDSVDRHGSRPGEWHPGADVVHAEHGRGWVWGSGRGYVTVRFESPGTPSGPVRSFAVDDPALEAAAPPEVRSTASGPGGEQA
jgi:DNA polymerase-4